MDGIAVPPLIDLAWDSFIIYTRNYKQFCDQMVGGLIYKQVTHPGKDWYQKYVETMEVINKASGLIQIFPNIFPKYGDHEEFSKDVEGPRVWLSQKEREEMIEFFEKELPVYAQNNPEKSFLA